MPCAPPLLLRRSIATLSTRATIPSSNKASSASSRYGDERNWPSADWSPKTRGSKRKYKGMTTAAVTPIPANMRHHQRQPRDEVIAITTKLIIATITNDHTTEGFSIRASGVIQTILVLPRTAWL